jgi:predicted membrane protein
MQTITTTERRRLPGWLWFVLLWCAGVGAAVGVGFAFKILMNVTLFAVMK